MKKLCFVYGTRPEWIKIKPIIQYLKHMGVNTHIIFTGQHKNMLDLDYDVKLSVDCEGINRLNLISSKMIANINLDDNILCVCVQGDTASALCAALVAYNNKIPIVHIEAGLRTYDHNNPFPEEGYRQIISRIASIHLCPTEGNMKILNDELCFGEKFVVGNTVLDNLVNLDIEYNNEIICTLHRRENVEILSNWILELNELAKKYTDYVFTLIKHPNQQLYEIYSKGTELNIIEQIPHDEMRNRLSKCKLIITDSGGLQEEGSFLNKAVIVCRKITERVNKYDKICPTTIICENPIKINKIFEDTINNYPFRKSSCIFGDGKSSEKIFSILNKKFNLL